MKGQILSLYKLTAIFLILCTLTIKSEKNLRLVLTDSQTFNLPTGGSVAHISDDGCKVFATPVGSLGEAFTFPPGYLPHPPFDQARLYDNIDGKLILKKSIRLQYKTFFNYDGGSASPNFSRFVLADDNNTVFRWRTFDANFNKIAQIIESNVVSVYRQPAFTYDSRFFVEAVTTYNSITNTYPNSLRLYQTDTLHIITEIPMGVQPVFGNGEYTAPLTYFTIHKHGKILEYVAIFTGHYINFIATTGNIEIFELKRKPHPTFTLVTKALLPQMGSSVNAVRLPKGKHFDHAILTVGTLRADLLNEVITLPVPQYSFLPNDGDELRVYTFDGKELCLVASQNTKMDVTATGPYPLDKGATVGTAVRNLPPSLLNKAQAGYPGASEVFNLRIMTHRPTDRVSKIGFTTIDQLYSTGPQTDFAYFSANGKWVIVAGCKGGQDVPPPQPVDEAILGTNNNLNLFKVKR